MLEAERLEVHEVEEEEGSSSTPGKDNNEGKTSMMKT